MCVCEREVMLNVIVCMHMWVNAVSINSSDSIAKKPTLKLYSEDIYFSVFIHAHKMFLSIDMNQKHKDYSTETPFHANSFWKFYCSGSFSEVSFLLLLHAPVRNM